jgi:hypothetical protein
MSTARLLRAAGPISACAPAEKVANLCLNTQADDRGTICGDSIGHKIDAMLNPVKMNDLPTLYDLISTAPNLAALKQVVDMAGAQYVNLLKDPEAQITVFAPPNTVGELHSAHVFMQLTAI